MTIHRTVEARPSDGKHLTIGDLRAFLADLDEHTDHNQTRTLRNADTLPITADTTIRTRRITRIRVTLETT